MKLSILAVILLLLVPSNLGAVQEEVKNNFGINEVKKVSSIGSTLDLVSDLVGMPANLITSRQICRTPDYKGGYEVSFKSKTHVYTCRLGKADKGFKTEIEYHPVGKKEVVAKITDSNTNGRITNYEGPEGEDFDRQREYNRVISEIRQLVYPLKYANVRPGETHFIWTPRNRLAVAISGYKGNKVVMTETFYDAVGNRISQKGTLIRE